MMIILAVIKNSNINAKSEIENQKAVAILMCSVWSHRLHINKFPFGTHDLELVYILKSEKISCFLSRPRASNNGTWNGFLFVNVCAPSSQTIMEFNWALLNNFKLVESTQLSCKGPGKRTSDVRSPDTKIYLHLFINWKPDFATRFHHFKQRK